MKLIRWSLSNIILIAFVLALTYADVYWDNLTGEETPAGKAIAYLSVEYDELREFLDSYDFGDGKADRVSEPEVVAEVTETASVPQAMAPPRVQPPRPSAQPYAPPQTMVQPPPVQDTRSPAPTIVTRQPPPTQVPAQQVPPTAMVRQPPAMQPAIPAPAQPVTRPTQRAAEPGETEVNVRELWISAREEYHRGNIERSISNYRQVIAHSDGNYDAYGELGNVYLSRGKYREAADAYFQAASILVKQGQSHRARSLLPMLERLDRSKAEELNRLMSTPRS